MLTKTRLHMLGLIVVCALLLAACGTLEVGLEPNAATAGPIQTETPPPAVPLPATEPPAPPVVEPDPSPSPVAPAGATETAGPAETPSDMWVEYRDELYGYGLALPCYWVTYPGFGTPSARSYDDLFAMAHSVRGNWIDGFPPAGVYKLDIGPFEYEQSGIPPGTTLAEAIPQLIDDTITELEPVTIGRQEAILAHLDTSEAMDIAPEGILFFELDEGVALLFSAYPRGALETADVQGILASLALSPEEDVLMPTFDPAGPVEGRSVHNDLAGGYCLQYPSEYALESYAPSQPGYLGDVLNLKLERPLYTTGMSIDVRRVAVEQTLDELVTQFIAGFGDDPAVTIERNPPESLGGLPFQMGGEPAEWLEGVPGPAGPGGPVTRDVFVKHENRLYHLTFTPSPQSNLQAGDDVELLFQAVHGSFSFNEIPSD